MGTVGKVEYGGYGTVTVMVMGRYGTMTMKVQYGDANALNSGEIVYNDG